MKCFNCKKEYKDESFSCPYCGAVNKKIYKDIKEREAKVPIVDKFVGDIRKKIIIKQDLPLIGISIIILLVAYFINYYYFNNIENNQFLYKISTNYPLFLLIFLPIILVLYYKKVSSISIILSIYFCIITCMSILFPFFYLLVFGEGYKLYIAIFLFPILIFIIFLGIKLILKFIKNKLPKYHIISCLLLITSTLYLLVTIMIIIFN